MLKFMYITNRPEIAQIAEDAGVDRIFVDMESLDKAQRQCRMDTVLNAHTIEDVQRIRAAVRRADLMVRVNHIYPESESEINAVIAAGADIIMLPYFKSVQEVEHFLRFVDGRARTVLLFETPEAVEHIDEILALPGIDECLVGLNDLHLGYGRKFLFELVADGTVERLCRKFREAGKVYGFGGIAQLGGGTLNSALILSDHVWWGSSLVILSRSFCDLLQVADLDEVHHLFQTEVARLRNEEERLHGCDDAYFAENHRALQTAVHRIVESMA